jgi:metallopeptidase MepB
MATDNFRQPPQAPPLFTGTPASITAAAHAAIAASRAAADAIVRDVTPDTATFATVLRPLAHAQSAATRERRVLGFYQDMAVDAAVRAASAEAERRMEDHALEGTMREDVFRLVDAVFKKGEELDGEDRLYLEKRHARFLRNGLGLPAGAQRGRLKEIKERLTQLSNEFGKNLNERKGEVWFLPEELEGLPDDFVPELEKAVDGENSGKVRVDLTNPDSDKISGQATRSETRLRYSMASAQMCKDNVPIFKETMFLRDEAARLLGYPNHATFRLEAKMAKNPKIVNDFLEDLRVKLAENGKKELDRLKAWKKADLEARGETYDGRFYVWDNSYYNRKMLKEKYTADTNKIAEYFPLTSTISGMLEAFETIFSLRFVELTGKDRDRVSPTGKGEDIVWHEDVQIFSAWDSDDQGGAFLGYLYLDMYPRHGKTSGGSNFNIQPVSRTPTQTLLTIAGLHRTRRLPPLPRHGPNVQLPQAHRQKTEPPPPRRRGPPLPRARPRHPRPRRQNQARLLPRHHDRHRFRRGAKPDARALVLAAGAHEGPQSALLLPVPRVPGGVGGAGGRPGAPGGEDPRGHVGRVDAHEARVWRTVSASQLGVGHV